MNKYTKTKIVRDYLVPIMIVFEKLHFKFLNHLLIIFLAINLSFKLKEETV